MFLYRLEFVGEISQSDVDGIPEKITKEVRSYINSTSGVYFRNIILTSNFTEVTKMCEKHTHVVIQGPKGCGKTYTLLVLFTLCLIKGKTCVFLSSQSFNKLSYFHDLFESKLKKENPTTMDELRDGEKGLDALQTGLQRLCKKYEDLMIFADLSNFDTKDFKNAHLLQTLISLNAFCSRVILSVSSGVDVCRNDEYEKYLKFFDGRVKFVTGFTTEEAAKYLEKRRCCWTLNQIRHISGTNPFMLSLISDRANFSISEYEGIVDTKVRYAMQKHVSGLVNNVRSIEEYFKKVEMLECADFIYLANRQDKLHPDQQSQYEKSWLHQHMLTVLDRTPDLVVLEDQDETDGDKIDLCKDSYPVLRWNFPILGKIFLDILRNFIKERTKNDLMSYCDKVSTFAGCWYECMFFSLLKDFSFIKVLCAGREGKEPTEITLKFNDVSAMDINTTISKHVIYEMRAYYPIVDAVGCLKDNDDDEWLVFIQISLAKYKHHRSLCDLFHKSNGHSNMSIYTYYRKLYSIERSSEKVLLLYFSPQEKPSGCILPDLEQQISELKDSHLKTRLKYGILSTKSDFYDYPEFKLYFKRYFTATNEQQ